AARPLADVLWMREREAGALDTPERRAAFEARLGEVTAAIADETVRKYYRREFGDRLQKGFASGGRPGREAERGPNSGGRGAANSEWRIANRGVRSGSYPQFHARHSPFATRSSAEPYVVLSPQLAASPVHRGHRAAIPRREALILQAAINHPWL